jgi:hypothetical protein
MTYPLSELPGVQILSARNKLFDEILSPGALNCGCLDKPRMRAQQRKIEAREARINCSYVPWELARSSKVLNSLAAVSGTRNRVAPKRGGKIER